MDALFRFLDQYCILLYRLTGISIMDYLVGTFLLTLISVLIGEFARSITYQVNRKYLLGLQEEMVRMQNLSLEALRVKDVASYEALNKEANESYGRFFFNKALLSAASLCPAFFALGWMQYRFSEVELPLPLSIPIFGESVSYIFVFILCYILSRILFRNIRGKLSYLRHVQTPLDEAKSSIGR